MERLFIKQLAYEPDGAVLFERIRDLPFAVFLDSNRVLSGRASKYNRYDVLAANPGYIIRNKNGTTTVTDTNGTVSVCDRPPLDCLRNMMPRRSLSAPYPFLTGLIGFFSYDFGRQIETLPSLAGKAGEVPDFMFGLYDWTVVIDHAVRQCTFIGYCENGRGHFDEFDSLCEKLQNGGAPPESTPSASLEIGEVVANMDKAEYLQKISRLKRHIYDGDCYQVNFSQHFSAPAVGDAWPAYRRLRTINPAPFSAYLDFGELSVLSVSPERFLKVAAGRVEVRPIKGTIARQTNHLADRCARDALVASEKDQAENLMIVDLMRNDLGRNCRTGSIQVSELFALESFANVHHLVSTITGELCSGRDTFDLLHGCFPGGSITGAPRLRAMEIIEALEPHRRGVYCGAIGYLGRNGDCDMNIAIRTAVHANQQFNFYAGGGIVYDSDANTEYREMLDKVSSLFDLSNQCRTVRMAAQSDTG